MLGIWFLAGGAVGELIGALADRSWDGESRCQGQVFEGLQSLVPSFLMFSCLPINESPSYHMMPKCSARSHGIEKPLKEECGDILFML